MVRWLRKIGRWAWGYSWKERALVVLVVAPPYFIGFWSFCLLPLGIWLMVTMPEQRRGRGLHDGPRYDAP